MSPATQTEIDPIMTTKLIKRAVSLDTPELASLPVSKADQIRETFIPMADAVEAFEDEYNEVMTLAAESVTSEVSQRARRLRLDIAKIRNAAEKARKSIKQEYLDATRAIDGVNNVLKFAISGKEEALEAIEKHAERMEANRIEALQAERADALSPYVEDAHERDLGSMDTDVWDAYLAAKKQAHDDRIEAEKAAEAARAQAEAEERADQERIRAENERLTREKDEAEAARQAELAKIEAERESERKAAEAEREKERKIATAERKKREDLEAADAARVQREKDEAEASAKATAEAAKAPTRKRLTVWVDSFALPDLPGDDHEAAKRISEKFGAFKAWAAKEAEVSA